MKSRIYYFAVAIGLAIQYFGATNLSGQNIATIHIQGDVKIMGLTEAPNKARPLVYGPIALDKKVKLAPNAKVKFLKSNNEICYLDKAGEYILNNLHFVPMETNSIFSKFCDYFQNFFTNHSSPESKDTYKNNIYAISRGDIPAPSLDFPLSGMLPADIGPISFVWTHCDTCTKEVGRDTSTYEFSIFEFESKKVVHTFSTKQKKYTLSNPDKLLQAGKKYFWNVKISKVALEYQSNSFTIAKSGDFDLKVKAIQAGLENDDSVWMDEIPKTIYIMSQLQEQKFNNFAILYGWRQAKKDPTGQLSDFCDRFLYDQLIAAK
jgi:hypothetical protein